MQIARALGGYADRRMPRIFLIGAVSGLPWVFIGSALSLWLRESGMDRSTVGFAGAITAVYAVNFLWAPLIDRLPLPYLTRRFGGRKAWILLCQAVIIACLLLWSLLDPAVDLVLVVGLGLVLAIASASQDITIDALRIEQVERGETEAMAAGAAVAVLGWWTGFKLGGLLQLWVADRLEIAGVGGYWQISFIVMALLVVLMAFAVSRIPEASVRKAVGRPRKSAGAAGPTMRWLKETLFDPLWAFFRQNGLKVALGLLAFIFLFKIGEAFLGKMSILFYREIGFSKTDIGLYSKGLGWLTTVAFTLVGGWVSMRLGTLRALVLAGIAMASTNLLFSALAWAGKVEWLFAMAVVLDDLAAAFSSVAFVAFISLLVDRRYTATQYALLASIGAAGRTLLAAYSGALVDALEGDWGMFFVITALMVVPSLLVLWHLAPDLGRALGRPGRLGGRGRQGRA